MKQFMTAAAVTLTAATFATGAWAQAKTDVRIMWYSDGVEGQVIRDLVGRFHQANPDINVIIDEIAFTALVQTLPVQLASGQGPDIARVVDLPGLAPHFLDLRPLVKDPAYWDANFGAFLPVMRPAGSNAITGYMTQVTVTGPFINKTLFEQAKVPVPGPKATWDEWAVAVKKVADATKTQIPLAIDRSGHRVAGPMISYGAKWFGADGRPAVTDEGFRKMAKRLVDWHNDGTMSKSLWGSVSGRTYRGANEEFNNGQVVMYMSGSWQIGQFANQIKDAFDWVAVPNPCGDVTCSPMPGGAGLVAIKYTKNPQQVARVMDYLASEPVLKEFYERTLFLPAHKGIAEKGLNFQTNDKHVKDALTTFAAQVPNISPDAFRINSYPLQTQVFGAVITRLGQAVAGELPLEQAYVRIDEDIANALREAGR
jgi:alpha-1,4-digalacturonate transport system substrate-binding protein